MEVIGKREGRSSGLTRRALLLGGAAGVTALVTRQCFTRADGPLAPYPTIPTLADGEILLNDASQLSPTPVASHVVIRNTARADVVERVRSALADARRANRPLIASAARHSMGGQSLAAHGTVVTLDQEWLELDRAYRTYRVAAGARWSTVIAKLDAAGFSPAVMQSNNDFGVASTFSVNAHGWPVPYSACGSTVRVITMVLADGSVVRCSRSENEDLFRHAMGGYGLFGVITELELEMVPNRMLTPTFERLDGVELGAAFASRLASDQSIQMAYGRMDVSLDRFLQQALLITYRPTAEQGQLPAARGSGLISRASRFVFREQLGSDTAKHLRWWVEADLQPHLPIDATRNSLLNEPVATLDDRDPSRTDILHEYFVSPERFADFVAACRDVIPSSAQQLLNVTLRYVHTDRDSVLAYATGPRIAAVMLFSQAQTAAGEVDMARMTRMLIERVLELGGTYYLPYRPHASPEQLVRGYPRALEFVAGKRESDRQMVFRNALWDRYFGTL